MASAAAVAEHMFPKECRLGTSGQDGQTQEQSLNETTTAVSTEKPPKVVVRKTLPWLMERPLAVDLPTSCKAQEGVGEKPQAPFAQANGVDEKASIRSLGGDLALRAIGSAPTLRQGNTKASPLAFSQSSQLPPGSKLSAVFIRRPKPASPKETAIVSSEYSAADSTDGSHIAGNSSRTSAHPPAQSSGSRAAPAAVARDASELRGTKKRKPNPDLSQTRVDAPSKALKKQQHRKLCEDRKASRKHHAARLQYERESRALYEDAIYKPPASRPLPVKKSTLHKLPPHLIASSESSSPRETREVNKLPRRLSDNINATDSFQPILSTAGRPNSSKVGDPLHRAVTGLENLMGEALDDAQNEANSSRPDEVADLLNQAASALRQADSVNNILGQPLVLSPAASMHSSQSSQDRSSSSTPSLPSRDASAETMPTILTKSSRQPLLVKPTSKPALSHRAKCAWVGDHLRRKRHGPSTNESISQTPPHLYSVPSAESVIRDFAYGEGPRRHSTRSKLRATYGAAASFYGDHGESVVTQPGVRNSIAQAKRRLSRTSPPDYDDGLSSIDPQQKSQTQKLRRVKGISAKALPSARGLSPGADNADAQQQHGARGDHLARSIDPPAFMKPAYYRDIDDVKHQTNIQGPAAQTSFPKASFATDHPALLMSRNLSLKHPRRGHLSIQEDQGFSLGRYHKRQPIARE